MNMEDESRPTVQPSRRRRRPHILAIPYPMMGHMTPIMQLCKTLIARVGCRVTIACQDEFVEGVLGKRLLQDVAAEDVDVLPLSNRRPPTSARLSWEECREILQAREQGLSLSFAPHLPQFLHDDEVVCVISDLYLSWTQDVADQLGVPRLAVWISSAAEFQVYSHAKELVNAGKLPFKAPCGRETTVDNMFPGMPGRAPIYHMTTGISTNEEKIMINGLPTLDRRDFPTFLQIEDTSDQFFSYFIEHIKTASRASMLLFNTFEALDHTILDVLRIQGIPAHSIGPLFMLEDEVNMEQGLASGDDDPKKGNASANNELECIKWLEKQKPNSVMFVAFGSLVQLTMGQVEELAKGLLNSEQAFIWVYPKGTTIEGREEFLLRFLEAVDGKGLVVEWAPQRLILKHAATGAFLSHCGWNSALESICSGVPMLCLPFLSDQTLICKLVVDEWKVGLRLERSSTLQGFALAPDISYLTTELLVGDTGKQLRQRALELKHAAEASTRPGGSSHATFHSILKMLTLKEREYMISRDQTSVQP